LFIVLVIDLLMLIVPVARMPFGVADGCTAPTPRRVRELQDSL